MRPDFGQRDDAAFLVQSHLQFPIFARGEIGREQRLSEFGDGRAAQSHGTRGYCIVNYSPDPGGIRDTIVLSFGRCQGAVVVEPAIAGTLSVSCIDCPYRCSSTSIVSSVEASSTTILSTFPGPTEKALSMASHTNPARFHVGITTESNGRVMYQSYAGIQWGFKGDSVCTGTYFHAHHFWISHSICRPEAR